MLFFYRSIQPNLCRLSTTTAIPRQFSFRSFSTEKMNRGKSSSLSGKNSYSFNPKELGKAKISTSLPNYIGGNKLGSENRVLNKRRNRIDLRTEEKMQNVGLSVLEGSCAVNVTSEEDEFSLPAQFGKKSKCVRVKSSKSASQSYSKYATGVHKVEPFDICLSESGYYAVSEGSLNGNDKINQGNEEVRQGVLRPGMVLLKHYINLDDQIRIVKACRQLGMGPGGFYRPGYQDGAKLRLQMMCLGLNWDPDTRKYEDRRPSDDCEPPPIPHEFNLLAETAIQGAHVLINKDSRINNAEDTLPAMSPDICIVNFYTTSGRLGLHQDRDESADSLRKGLPVVSLSLGDSAVFLYGDHRNVDKAEKIWLESGDVLIFGGKSRHIYHGVSSIIPNSAPRALVEESRLRPGRLNLTFRQY